MVIKKPFFGMLSHSDLYRTNGKGYYKVKKGATPICRQFTKPDLIWVSSTGEQIFAHVSVLAAQSKYFRNRFP